MEDIVLFDDEYRNILDVTEIGAKSFFVTGGGGLTLRQVKSMIKEK